jgi:hypothetical protein
MLQIIREWEACARLGCKRTKFREQYRLNDPTPRPDDEASGPYVSDTKIPRLRPIPLGVRSIGYLSVELDALITALAAQRDSAPPRPRITRLHIRDALPPRERERRALLEARARLRSQLTGDADPELRERLEALDEQLRELDEPQPPPRNERDRGRFP